MEVEGTLDCVAIAVIGNGPDLITGTRRSHPATIYIPVKRRPRLASG
jgi:hypothetical protein